MVSEHRAVRVKICGITNEEDAHGAVESGAHALGFVFYPPSPRYVAPEVAANIISSLPPFVFTVGIFVNSPPVHVKRVVEIAGLHGVQLHGNEAPQQYASYSLPVVKAIRLEPDLPLPDLSDHRVSAVLVDAWVSGMWGGSGKTVDWQRLSRQWEQSCSRYRHRLILAGGLTPENVGQAISVVRPFAVDVSSGVEIAPGKKCKKLMKEFTYVVLHASCD